MPSKNTAPVRGRPARKLGPDFFLPVLVELKDAPKTLDQLGSEMTNYFMAKIEARGYVEPTSLKVTTGRGRPTKAFALTRKGREYIRKTNARKADKA